MGNMINNKLTVFHKLILLLIVKVKSCNTIYNLDKVNGLFGIYVDDSIGITNDLVDLELVTLIKNVDSSNKFETTTKANKLIFSYEDEFIKEIQTIIKNERIFLKMLGK